MALGCQACPNGLRCVLQVLLHLPVRQPQQSSQQQSQGCEFMSSVPRSESTMTLRSPAPRQLRCPTKPAKRESWSLWRHAITTSKLPTSYLSAQAWCRQLLDAAGCIVCATANARHVNDCHLGSTPVKSTHTLSSMSNTISLAACWEVMGTTYPVSSARRRVGAPLPCTSSRHAGGSKASSSPVSSCCGVASTILLGLHQCFAPRAAVNDDEGACAFLLLSPSCLLLSPSATATTAADAIFELQHCLDLLKSMCCMLCKLPLCGRRHVCE